MFPKFHLLTPKNKAFIANVLERACKAFILGYAAVWQTSGLTYEKLFTEENLQGGIVAFFLSLFISFGVRNLGKTKNDPSIFS